MLDEKPYFCRHCKNPVASTNNKVLSVGLLDITQPVKFKCRHCGRTSTWRPAAQIPKAEVVLLSQSA